MARRIRALRLARPDPADVRPQRRRSVHDARPRPGVVPVVLPPDRQPRARHRLDHLVRSARSDSSRSTPTTSSRTGRRSTRRRTASCSPSRATTGGGSGGSTTTPISSTSTSSTSRSRARAATSARVASTAASAISSRSTRTTARFGSRPRPTSVPLVVARQPGRRPARDGEPRLGPPAGRRRTSTRSVTSAASRSASGSPRRASSATRATSSRSADRSAVHDRPLRQARTRRSPASSRSPASRRTSTRSATDSLLTIGVGGDDDRRELAHDDLDVRRRRLRASVADRRLSRSRASRAWGWSEALWEHKAFQYFAPKKLLAVPQSN